MNGIALSRERYKFLTGGLPKGKAGIGSRLTCYILNEEKILLTTNGYVIHATTEFKSTGHIPGYYVWSKANDMLLRLDDEVTEGTPDLMKSATNVMSEYMAKLENSGKMQLLSSNMGHISVGLSLEPRTKGSIGFRKGFREGKEVSICLGIGYANLIWGEEGEISERGNDDVLVLDAEFLANALPYVDSTVMRWTTPTRPALFGNPETDFAIVMPLFAGSTHRR